MFECFLYNSAMSKAVRISPAVKGPTIGPSASTVAEPEDFRLPPPDRASTPKKKPGRDLSAQIMPRRPRVAAAAPTESTKEKLLQVEFLKTEQNKVADHVKRIEEKVFKNEETIKDALNDVYINHINKHSNRLASLEEALMNKFKIKDPDPSNDLVKTPQRENAKKLEHAQRKTLQLRRDAFKNQLYKSYLLLYAEVLDVCKSCKDINSLEKKSKTLSSIKMEKLAVEDIMVKISDGPVTEKDIKIMENYIKNVRECLLVIGEEVREINEAIRKQIEAEKMVEKVLLEKVEQETEQQIYDPDPSNDLVKTPQRENAKKLEHAQRKTLQLRRDAFKNQLYKSYLLLYAEVLDVCKSCKDINSLEKKSKTLSSIKMEKLAVEDIMVKISDGPVTEKDIKIMENYIKNVRECLLVIGEEVREINEAIRKQIEAEKMVEKVLLEKVEQETEQQIYETSPLADCFDQNSYETYTRLTKLFNDVHNSLKPFQKDPIRFELHKAATLPVNAISPVSGEHMLDKYKKLHTLLSGHKVVAGKKLLKDHPVGMLLINDIVAKLFVKQGEMTVSSKPDAAFALASIIVNLWTEFSGFGEMLLAYFQKKCPYLAPVYLPQLEGQTDEQYYEALGYVIQDGKIENQDMYLKRMKGIARLYAAILVTSTRTSKPHPLGLKEAWRLLGAILNLPPRPDISAVIILEILEVCGSSMLTIYKGQAKKMIAFICKEYFGQLEQVTGPSMQGPLSRLKTFLEKTAIEGVIPAPAVLSPRFW